MTSDCLSYQQSISPASLFPELPSYQVLVHVLILHPLAQVVEGDIELVLAEEDLAEESLEGWLGTDIMEMS